MSADSLENRVTALEAEVALLKQAVESKQPVPWWQEWAGAFRKDPYFAKAMAFGRQYRESLRPEPRKAGKGKHGHDAS